MWKRLVRQLRNSGEGDRGAAIVAAIGVMMICISLGVLVISQAVASQRESARNRARTVEIHSAEAIVDQLFSELQHGNFQCEWEFDDPAGADGVVVYAEVQFWNEAGDSLCGGDIEEPVRAEITATSSNTKATMAGIEPERTFEAQVQLKELRNPSASAAIFSASELQMNNAVFVEGTTADVWTDKDNFTCEGSSGRDTITGNLYVPNGTARLDNSCVVAGNVYSSGHLSIPSMGIVRGDAYVKSSGISLGTSAATIYGHAIAPDGASGQGSVKGGITKKEPTPFPTSSGLPEVEYAPADWYAADNWDDASEVFVPWSGMGSNAERTAWKKIVDENGVLNKGSQYTTGRQCVPMNNDWGNVGSKLRLPEIKDGPNKSTVPRVFDARDCELSFRGTGIELYGDTVIFAKKMQFDSGFSITSGDGQSHRLWFIVPYEFRGANPTMSFTQGLNVSNNINLFLYNPGRVQLSNPSDFKGNIYGHEVTATSGLQLESDGLGIPGVDLMPGYVDPEAQWQVDVVFKRETGDRVN